MKRVKNLDTTKATSRDRRNKTFDGSEGSFISNNQENSYRNPFEYSKIKKYAINRTLDAFNVADNSLVKNVNFDIKPVFFMSKKTKTGGSMSRTGGGVSRAGRSTQHTRGRGTSDFFGQSSRMNPLRGAIQEER